jgi:hypothetical protein
MTITKTHIVKQIVKGKIITTKTECGLNAWQNGGRFNNIVKTSEFKNIYNATQTESCCEKCIAKAKEQGRI